MALSALDRSGVAYRVAYTCENCAGQEAALLADLAVAPLPLSMVRAPLRKLGDEAGLPLIGEYRIILVHRAGAGSASGVLAGHIIDAFRNLR